MATPANGERVVMVTGAAGFLGSAATLDLARDAAVIAIDRRAPSRALLEATPHVDWHQVDVADRDTLADVFQSTKRRLGRIDFVLHLAAFYHFGSDRHPEYQRTNIDGTSAVLHSAIDNGAGRLIFASSIAAMLPPPSGEMLTERSPTSDYIPYGASKSAGEQMTRDALQQLPAVVLRIGGVFTDWCELPPLDSLIRLWAGRFPLNRIIAGNGATGIPYVHRDDFVRLVRACVHQSGKMPAFEVLLASQHGTVSHRELFEVVQQTLHTTDGVKPIFISPTSATIGLYLRRAWGLVTRDPPYEQPWMLRFIDRPWIADTTYTRNQLGWDCAPDQGILDRLPTMLNRYLRRRREWEQRSRARMSASYVFAPESQSLQSISE